VRNKNKEGTQKKESFEASFPLFTLCEIFLGNREKGFCAVLGKQRKRTSSQYKNAQGTQKKRKL
jgi:hypothetical protein